MNRWMEFHKAMTIGEIVPFALQFMQANPAHPSFHKFDYVLVDEYQDLNKAEQVIIDEIARDANLVVVGDDNQSIYSFKNAHPEGIREFSLGHDPCTDIVMQECRRCPKSVVAIADSLIRNDTKYRGLDEPVLMPFEANDEGQVDVIQWNSFKEEAEGLAIAIKLMLDKNPGDLEPQDVLVLNPSKVIARMINDGLNKLGVPSQVVSKSVDLILNCDEAKRIHALLTFLSNKKDLVSLRYLLHKDGNFYPEQYGKIQTMSEKENILPIEVLQGIVDGNISLAGITSRSAIVKRYIELAGVLEKWEGYDNLEEFVSELVKLGGENAQELSNKLLKLLKDFEPQESEEGIVMQFAKHIVTNVLNLLTSSEDIIDDDKARVMTYHSAKGLSGKFVVVSSCVEGLIPRRNEDTTQDDIDEQRRLFYVAVTRCKHTRGGFPGKLLFSSFVKIKQGEKLQLGIKVPYNGVHASRFLQEIDSKILPQPLLGNEYLDNLSKS